MEKLSFEEWTKLKKEYEEYLAGEDKPEGKPDDKPGGKPDDKPEGKLDDKSEEKPENTGFEKELAEIKKQMEIMAKALSPSLGDIKPVGIDDVVTNLFNLEKKED